MVIFVEKILKRIPTGIPSLDSIIGGGFPSGSFVLLMGESGGGHREFTYTSAMMTASMKMEHTSAPLQEGVVFPKKIYYVLFTRPKEDVIAEISRSFAPELYKTCVDGVTFEDLSESYFQTSAVPPGWIPGLVFGPSAKKKKQSADILELLVNFLNKNASGSVIYLHTLTDLARLYMDSPRKFTTFLLGLQRAAKNWDGLIYAILSTGILDAQMQEDIVACSDGVLVFRWEEAGPVERRRMMYFRKFRGLLPHIEDRISKFQIRITRETGFMVSKVEMIKALR